MPRLRVRSDAGIDLDDLDFEDFAEAALVSTAPDRFVLSPEPGVEAIFTGSFDYADGPGALPTSGTLSAFRLVEDGEVEAALSGLSIDLAPLLAALGTEEDAEDDDDPAEAEAEALLEAFDIDPFQDGGALVSTAPDAFEVAWGEETARFEGSFEYADGPDAYPTSGTITAFTFSEEGAIERELDGLSVPVETLLEAMERLTAEDGPDDDGHEDDATDGPEGSESGRDVFTLLDGLLDGHDRLVGSAAADALAGRGGRDRLIGRDGEDDLDGGAGRDRLQGGAGDDRLDGGDGRDRLKGGAGDDVLIGGAGRDMLFGGAGADVFDFDDADDAGRGRNKDRIRDFEDGADLIDLSDIDADPFAAGDQAFELISGRFSGTAGELSFRKGKLKADLDGDGDADMVIRLHHVDHVEADDFIL